MGADLTLPNPPLPQGAALECSFGREEIFEAVWVNESAVCCDQVVVSGVALTAGVGGRGEGEACASPDPTLLPFYLLFLDPLPPVALPSSVSLTPLPQQRPGTTHTAHGFSCPSAAAHSPEEPGVSTQPPAKGAARPIPGQP